MTLRPEWDQMERILARVGESPSGCWIASTWLNHQGYALARLRGLRMMAHRATYSYFRGDIPDGLEIDHLCRVRSCLNPWHLEPVTRVVNALRSEPASRTRCINGHPRTDENIAVRSNGWRACRPCERERKRVAK